jgi:hypothetical protein
MTNDPSIHRQRQDEFIEHVRPLLEDPRLRIDTTAGRRAVTTFYRDVNFSDHAVDLKRLMSEMGKPDRELEARMPFGREMEVLLSRRSLFFFKKPVGRLRIVCVSPDRALLAGQSPQPLAPADVNKILSQIPPPLPGVPATLVLMSTSGFTMQTHELTERTAGRTLILVEPNASGGWSVHGPPQTQALTELFDPEQEQQKRRRIAEAIEAASLDLSGSGVAADKLASTTHLSLQMIEGELKAFAKAHPGLAARRLDGRMVLFREGSIPPSAAKGAALPGNGGSDMPLIDRIRSLFSRKGENEKKIAFLSERRTLLSQQRDRAYEEITALETQDVELRDQFKAARTPLTKKRLTSQLLQLRKEMERRQQMLSVFNQQINVVGTHLHNIELVQQGQHAQLPDGEELASDAAAAEEMLAELEAGNELAGSLSTGTLAGLTAEEQALYEELEKESAPPAPAEVSSGAPAPAAAQRAPASPAPPQRIREPEAE